MTENNLNNKFIALENQLTLQYNQLITSMNLHIEKLSAIAQSLSFINADTDAQLATLQALPGVSPNNTIAALWAKLNILEGTIDDNWPTQLQDIHSIETQFVDLITRVDRLQAAIGAVPYNDLQLGSARGLLYSILLALKSQQYGTTPTLLATDVPNAGFVDVTGRRYALFIPPITGVTIASNGYDLTPATNWTGWNAYIQTNDPAPKIGNTASTPNQWLALTGSGSVNFNVATNYNITVYLRAPANTGYVWYWDLGEIQSVSTGSGVRYLPITSKYADLTFINFNANAPRCLSTATNFGGWQWEITAPSPQSVYGTDTLSAVISAGTGTIPAGGTNRWVVQSVNQPAAGTYIRIYPAQPS